MAFNNGFPESYQNGFQQNSFPQYSYNQQQQYVMPQSYQTAQNFATAPQMNNNMQNNAAQQQQQNNNGIIWVQGEAGAKAYPLAPNNKILLMDSEAPVLYVKSVNANGIPDPLMIYDLVERKDMPESQRIQTDVSIDKFKEIEARLDVIENKLQSNTVNNNNNIGKQNNKQRRNNNG